MLHTRGYQMHTGYMSNTWQRASGWFVIMLISATAITSLLPGRADAYSLEPASLHPSSQPSTSPAANAPTISPTPNQGPVKTLVTLQGTDWPPESQVLISYDSDPSCSGPDLTELSPDPKPTVNSAGRFSTSFSWPTVSETGSWYVCAATSDRTATGTAVFTVLSLSPPSLTILTKGPFMPGQTMTVQGQNWLPGGWNISFALQPVQSTASFPLEETVISLFNGTFEPISITIPLYLAPGSYILVATMEQRALEAHSTTITIEATPTPTPTATPSPSPTPPISATATPIISNQQPPSTPRRLSGTLLALVIISGSMALAFALIGGALLMYLMRKRALSPASPIGEPYDETGQLKPKSSE
jgi:hypothetical protein